VSSLQTLFHVKIRILYETNRASSTRNCRKHKYLFPYISTLAGKKSMPIDPISYRDQDTIEPIEYLLNDKSPIKLYPVHFARESKFTLVPRGTLTRLLISGRRRRSTSRLWSAGTCGQRCSASRATSRTGTRGSTNKLRHPPIDRYLTLKKTPWALKFVI
jgi:hypothetical protein